MQEFLFPLLHSFSLSSCYLSPRLPEAMCWILSEWIPWIWTRESISLGGLSRTCLSEKQTCGSGPRATLCSADKPSREILSCNHRNKFSGCHMELCENQECVWGGETLPTAWCHHHRWIGTEMRKIERACEYFCNIVLLKEQYYVKSFSFRFITCYNVISSSNTYLESSLNIWEIFEKFLLFSSFRLATRD